MWQDRRERRKELSINVRAKEEAYAAWLSTCWAFINHCTEIRSKTLVYVKGNEGEVKALSDRLHLLATELDSARALTLLREEDDSFRGRCDQVHGRVSLLGVKCDGIDDAIAELRKLQLDLANLLSAERKQAAKG